MVNRFMFQLGLVDFSNRNLRERVEKVINSEAYEYRTAKSNKQNFNPIFLSHIPEIDVLLNLWNTITEIRNDIDHAGFRENARSSSDLIKNIKKLIPQMRQLTLPVEEI
jgi:hypothetical protein